MTYEELVTAYGHSIGIHDIEVDAEGAVFEIEDVPVTVRPDTASERITLMAEIGDFAAERRGEVTTKLLQLSFATMLNGGLALGASEEQGKYYCLLSLPLPGLEVERFELELIAMMNKAKAAQNLLGIEAEVAQAIAAKEHEQAASGADTFIRV